MNALPNHVLQFERKKLTFVRNLTVNNTTLRHWCETKNSIYSKSWKMEIRVIPGSHRIYLVFIIHYRNMTHKILLLFYQLTWFCIIPIIVTNWYTPLSLGVVLKVPSIKICSTFLKWRFTMYSSHMNRCVWPLEEVITVQFNWMLLFFNRFVFCGSVNWAPNWVRSCGVMGNTPFLHLFIETFKVS